MEKSLEEGFSIRDFTSKMRAVDATICWPFEDVCPVNEVFLPPLATPKFKWWLHGLPKEISCKKREVEGGFSMEDDGRGLELKEVMVCPVCLTFKALKVNALNAHVDRCLVLGTKKGKRKGKVQKKGKGSKEEKVNEKKEGKLRRKRSIVELFAVAPQVETQEEEEDENAEEEEVVVEKKKKTKRTKAVAKNLKAFKKRKSMKKGKAKRADKEEEERTLVEKKRKRAKAIAMNLRAIKEAEFNKCLRKKTAKCPNKVDSHELFKSSPHTSIGQLKDSMSDKKLQTLLNYTASFRGRKLPQKNCSPVKNNLTTDQNYKKVSLCHQVPPVFPIRGILKDRRRLTISNSGNLLGTDQTGILCAPHLERRVKFVGVDNILHESTRSPRYQIRSHSKLTSTFNDVSSKRVPEEVNDELCVGSRDEGLARGRNREQIFVSLDPESRARLELENWVAKYDSNVSMPKYAAPNQTIIKNKGKGPSKEFINLNSSVPNFVSSQALQNSLSCRRLISSKEIGNNDVTGAQKQGDVQVVPSRSVHGVDLSGQIFSKDFRSSSCSSDDWKMREFVCSNRCINDQYIGLPLNSKGELVRLQSSSGGFQKKSYVKAACPQDSIKLSSPKILFNNILGQSTEKAVQCQDPSLGNTDFVHHRLYANLKLINLSSHEPAEQCEHEKSTRPTVRLMGKDVTLGKRNEYRDVGDDNIWSDKEIIVEHPAPIIDRNTPVKVFTQTEIPISSSRNSSTNLMASLEAQRNSISARNCQMKPIDPLFSLSCLEPHPSSTSLQFQELLTGASKYPQSSIPKTDPIIWRSQIPVPPHLSPNNSQSKASKFSESSIPRTDPIVWRSQIPVPPRLPPIDSQPMLLNSARHTSNQSRAGTLNFQFPFSTSDNGEHGFTHEFPPWLERICKQSPTHPFSVPTAKGSPYTVCANTFSAIPSQHYGPFNSCTKERGSQSSLFAQPQLITVPPGIKDASSLSTNYERAVDVPDEVSPKYVLQKECEFTTTAKDPRKRLSTKEIDSTKVMKKFNLDLQNYPSVAMAPSLKKADCSDYKSEASAYPEKVSKISGNRLRATSALRSYIDRFERPDNSVPSLYKHTRKFGADKSYQADAFKRSDPSEEKCENHTLHSYACRDKAHQVRDNGFSSSNFLKVDVCNGSGTSEVNNAAGSTLEPSKHWDTEILIRMNRLKDSHGLDSYKEDDIIERSRPTKLRSNFYTFERATSRDKGNTIGMNEIRGSCTISSSKVIRYKKSGPAEVNYVGYTLEPSGYKDHVSIIRRNGLKPSFGFSKVDVISRSGATKRNCDISTFEATTDRDKMIKIPRIDLKDSCAVRSSMMGSFEKLGVAKLNAGSKHILKPIPVTDQVKSHSTNPLDLVAKKGSIPSSYGQQNLPTFKKGISGSDCF